MTRLGPIVFLMFCACNPFLSDKSGVGQVCDDDSNCLNDLKCNSGYCEKPVNVDCSEADCSMPGLADQGDDHDLDGWGSCCDCDDEHADINPGQEEIPYNQKDDDCSGATSDGDFDLDGYDAVLYDGEDCDDSDFNVHPGVTELCNGKDDNCDTNIDEGFGVGEPCEAIGECPAGVFECASDDSTVCSTMPGGSDDRSENEICDGLDNDCDAQTDEDAPFLLIAESGEQAVDGIDNNCNGLVDEPGGVMVPVHQVPGSWIDAYESTVFENPDCTGTRYGEASDDYPAGFSANGIDITTTLYACSVPGVIPSGFMSRYRVQLACSAQGKRLCTEEEFVNSCSNSVSLFPYASIVFTSGFCNDPQEGAGHAVLTGSYPVCTAREDSFDMSGNLAEWISKGAGAEHDEIMGFVAGWSYSDWVCTEFGESCHSLRFDDANDKDILKRVMSCPIGDERFLKYPITRVRDDFGGRCCMDGP